MTYGGHVSRAARYAALALTEPPPPAGDLPQLLVLRDDFAGALAELATALSGRTRRTPFTSIAQLTGDPVGALVARLGQLPTLGPGWEDQPPPSERWSGRPADPGAATTTLDVWKGLAVETALAADTVQRAHCRPEGAAQWAALGDVAALAEALTALDPPHVAAAASAPEQAAVVLDADAALGVEAREVAALAAGVRADDHAAGPPRSDSPRVVLVSRLSALPAATSNLTRLLHRDGTPLGAASVNAASLALARTSLAGAAALDAAASAPGAELPDLLRATAAALGAHGTRLRRAMEAHSARLATLDPGSPVVREQAREIAGCGAGRVRDLAARPAAALAASPDLLEYAARLGDATDALALAVEDLDRRGLLLTRDRSEHPRRAGWVPTNQLDAATTLLRELRQAADAARTAPTPPRPWAPEPAVTPAGPVVDLRHALARRRTALRPGHPAVPPRAVPPGPAAGAPSR